MTFSTIIIKIKFQRNCSILCTTPIKWWMQTKNTDPFHQKKKKNETTKNYAKETCYGSTHLVVNQSKLVKKTKKTVKNFPQLT